MSPFEFISVALSIVVGLGVTQLLRGAVTVFRARREHPVDALPVTWAFIVFLTIIQFWWALFELDAADLVVEWSLGAFLLLLWLAVLLYLAAALVLPGRPTDLTAYFDDDGRWALAMLAVYGMSGLVVNALLFGSGLGDPAQIGIYVTLVLLAGVIFVKRRGVRIALTVIYLLMMLSALSWAAPTTYSG
ncbi:MAG: hypothetical protein R3253_17405 [Longimicrobiales bacterium]|nr:hypothetical protein [Longimicrobiales bacterium]